MTRCGQNHSSPCRSCTLATLPSGSPTKVELGDGVLSLHIAPRTTALNVVIDLSPRLMRELRRSGSSDGSPVRPPVTPSSLGPVRVGTSRSQRVASVGPYSHSRVASRVNTKGGAAPAIINDPFAISQDGPSLPSPVAGPSALSLAHRVPGEASLPSGSLTHTGTQSGTVAVVGPDVLPAPKPANAPAVAIRRNVDITKPHINDDRNRVLALICAYSERKGCVMCDLHGHEYQHHETRCPRAFDYTNPGYAEFLRLVAFVPAPACMHCWLPLVSSTCSSSTLDRSG